MTCKNCGNSIHDGMLQCPMCGTKVDTQQAQQEQYTQQGQYSQQEQNNQSNQNWNNQGTNTDGQFNNYGGTAGGGMGWNNGMGNQPNIGNAPNFTMFIIIGIIYCICCCNIIVGIPAIIFTIMMNTAYKEGRQKDYLFNKKVAKWIYIGGAILWAISLVLGLVFNIFGAMFSMFGGY